MGLLTQQGSAFGPDFREALLGEQVASGNDRALTGAELTGMDSGGVKFPDQDPLTMSTSHKPKEMITGVNTPLPSTGSSAGGSGNISGTEGAALNKPKSFEISPEGIVGLAGVSAGAGLVQNAMNLKEQEAMHLEQLNEQWREFEFTQRMNRTAKMVSDTRGLLASIKNINRQVARGDDQQFISSPTTGSLL